MDLFRNYVWYKFIFYINNVQLCAFSTLRLIDFVRGKLSLLTRALPFCYGSCDKNYKKLTEGRI